TPLETAADADGRRGCLLDGDQQIARRLVAMTQLADAHAAKQAEGGEAALAVVDGGEAERAAGLHLQFAPDRRGGGRCVADGAHGVAVTTSTPESAPADVKPRRRYSSSIVVTSASSLASENACPARMRKAASNCASGIDTLPEISYDATRYCWPRLIRKVIL